MGWKDAPAVAPKAAWQSAPEVGTPIDVSIPTAEVLARRKSEKPFNTGADISGKLMDLWEASKLEGLMPEVNPVGGVARQPFMTTRATEIMGGLDALKGSAGAKRLGDVLSRMGEAAGSVGSTIKSIPGKLAAFESGKNPEALNTIYQAYKQNIPELKQAITEATPLGQELHSDMIYNYARQLGLSHEDALLAEDYTRNHPKGLGAWDIAMGKYDQFPNMPAAMARKELAAQVYKPFEQLNEAERLKQATQAGVDTAAWSPIPARTGQNDFANIGMAVAKKAIMPSIMHVTAPLSSPRIARMAAILAGKGANVAGKVGEGAKSAYEMLPQASIEDLINAGIVLPKNRNRGEE